MSILASLFGWVPVVGPALQAAEVAKRAYEVAKKLQLSPEQVAANSGRLNEMFTELATNGYDEHLSSYVDELELPGIVTEKARDKAIAIMAGELEKRYQNRTTQTV